MGDRTLSDLPIEIVHLIVSRTVALHPRAHARARQWNELSSLSRTWHLACALNRHYHVGSLAQIRALGQSLAGREGEARTVRRLTLELREDGKARSKVCAELLRSCGEVVELCLAVDWAYGPLGKVDKLAPDRLGRPLLDALCGLKKLEHFSQPWYSEICAQKLALLLEAWPNLVTLDLIQLRITDQPLYETPYLPTNLRSLRFPAGSAGLPLLAALVSGASSTLTKVDVQYLDSLSDARQLISHLEEVLPRLRNFTLWGWRAEGAPVDAFVQAAVARMKSIEHLVIPNAGIHAATFLETVGNLSEMRTVEVRTYYGAPLDWKTGDVERFLRSGGRGQKLQRLRVPRQLLEHGVWSREQMDELREIGAQVEVEVGLSVF